MTDNAVKILNEMLECNASCAGDFSPMSGNCLYEEDMLAWMYKNLPTLPYVISQIVDFIFSNGLTTGDETQDEKLDAFMFTRNINGVMHHTIVREGLKQALIYGKHGLRWLGRDAGLISFDSKRYGALLEKNEEYYGFDEVAGYILAMDDTKIWDTQTTEIDLDWEVFERQGRLVDVDKKLLIVGKGEFLSLRNNPLTENGDSPLKFDLQRSQLLANIYERLNYDVKYDGPGRILLRLKDGWDKKSDIDTGASTVVNGSQKAKEGRSTKAKQEADLLGRKIKESGSDSVIVVSNMFDKDIERLPRTTRAIEFTDFVTNEGVIMAQIFGVPPALIGLGRISGNVSMEKIIDNAMVNSIIPMRERFATQLSGFLAPIIGVEKIYFNKYEMRQTVDENDRRVKVVGMVEKLRKSGDKETADRLIELLNEDLEDTKL